MKTTYYTPELEIIEFDTEDVITTSPPDVNNPDTPKDGWG